MFILCKTALNPWELLKVGGYFFLSAVHALTMNSSSVQPIRHSPLCSLHSRLAEECLADAESFLVPIAVGVALIVLILIVLLAYFIGRKRNMATGYESF